MSIGRIIYYHRKKQSKTQEQLCKGICSTTHLSKIENSSKEGNLETLELLCKRLGVSIEEETAKTLYLKRQLVQFYEAIERLHRDHAERLYQELEKHRDYIQCTEMVYLYELYMLRYLLFTNSPTDYERASLGLKKNMSKFSSFEKYLWEFFQGIYYGQKQQYSKAIAIFDKIEDKADLYSDKVTDYHYYKAANHGLLKHFTLSLHYSHKALRIFQNTGNILRILHVKIGLSANLIYINDFERAEDLLHTALNDAEMLKDNESKITALHNFGLLNRRKGSLQKSLDYFSQSLKLKKKHTMSYYGTLVELVQVLLDLEESERAITLLQENLRDFKEQDSIKYIELMVVYLDAIKDDKRLCDYLIDRGLPVMKQYDLYKSATFSERLAAYFKEKGDLVSSNEYLQLSNELLKKLIFNHNEPI
ncbi:MULTISPECIES: helix-turn-helix transcriptional regulator [Bacillaceae]|uniref:helix-turn-helix transcriptional regulator n=1 Tax=Bacillaceae TaxID=186817 RepID=UPI001C59FE93|nr:helix-turn-helix transcriptional regulator [Rossellomorea sp. YZS02]MBW3110963.1 helix-turn-helix transcriptional regulator [Bacillus sp. MCCB 382]MDX8344289.1 helix-turn-helix transcriptional regulator [Rossellomorea sp. YZS02]